MKRVLEQPVAARHYSTILGAGCAACIAWGVPDGALAQDMSFDLEDVEAEQEERRAEKPKKKREAAKKPRRAEPAGDVLSEIIAEGEGEEEGAEEAREHHAEVVEEVYVVQQIYALRNGRLELAPSIAFTVNDQYMSHNSLAAALNLWITNVLAVGANLLWYQGFENESLLNFSIRRSTRLAVPITEYQLGAHLNFTYVPIYGKFSMFNEYLFQYDSYLIGGVGMMRTRPVAVVDPAIRNFSFDWRVSFNVGVGIRVFVTRYLTFFAELRDYIYLERLENLSVALGPGRPNPDTWIDQTNTLTNNVAIHLGLTLFFPFTFEYTKPK